ncbi:MAG: RNA-binding cell elongation regulator Jag/EloR [Acidimicrobiales bacterium]
MEWVETTGRTVEEAKDAALDQLGVDEEDAEFEVLEEPRHGLFGRLRTEARVRARVRPNRPRPKEDRRDRRRRNRGSARPQTTGDTAGPPPEPAEPGPVAPPVPSAASAADRKQEGAKMDQDVPLREQAEVATDFLEGLLAAFRARGEVAVHEVDDETVELAITGSDLGLLIGSSGSTLTALQEITRTVVQRQTGGRNGRLLVDVGGYRQKRKEALTRFTESVAAQVRETGVSKALEPMHAADRKVVHDTVNGLEGVRTTSEGEEPRRRVVISPS